MLSIRFNEKSRTVKTYNSSEDPLNRLYRQYAKGSLHGAYLKNNFLATAKRLLWQCLNAGSTIVKRTVDILLSSLALLAFSPIFALTALAIKWEDGGSIFYSQTRIGKSGRQFQMFKFRSMVENADKLKDNLLDQNEAGGVTFKMKSDPRVTTVGHFIRKYSIDEFPQFYNVFSGDMSMVGPRPPVPREVAEYSCEERRRLEVKPGITCFWQVNGRSDIDFAGQVRLDIDYIRQQCFREDFKILFKTVPAVLSGKGAY